MTTNGFFLEWHRKGFSDGAAAGWEAGYLQALQDTGAAPVGPVPEPEVAYVPPVEADLNETIEELRDKTELSVLGYNSLKREGINTVGDLVMKTEADIMDIRNIGRGTLDLIKLLLTKRGLALKSIPVEGTEATS